MKGRPHLPEPNALSRERKGRLYLRLLGGFAVRLGTEEVPDAAFTRRKPKSLLKLLALQPGQRLHREQAIEWLWAGHPPQSAAAQLYKAVHQARKALGVAGSGIAPEEMLRLRDQELRLEAPGGVETDVEIFTALARRALALRQQAALEAALVVYPGDLLPTDLYEEWTQEPREELREQATALATALGEVRLEADELPEALEAFGQALRLDPLEEAAHRGILRVYARQGDRAGLERHYRHYTAVLGRLLDAAPSGEMLELYQALLEEPRPLLAGAASAVKLHQRPGNPGTQGPEEPGHNLPIPPGPFIGRGRELAEIAECLSGPECRLLTLVGPGGVGKTRLALQAAAERLEDFAGGVYFVPLAQVAGPEFLLGTIAQALRVVLYPGSDPKAQLLERLRGQSVLLLLDNFEHLLGGAALLPELLGASPRLRLLVTSRTPLGLSSEWLLEVGGLDYPRSPQGAEAYSAVRLFLSHLRRLRPGFAPTAQELAAIVRVCQLVEGFPLSLELAAAQGRHLSCQEIAFEIERGLGVLEATLRDLPLRHRSQRAAFEPSWQSLSPHEQRVFAQLSVFRGGFRREAALAVAGAGLAVLHALADHSLVRRTSGGRYELHELLRQFGEEKLGGQPEVLRSTRAHHARYYCQLLARQEPRLKGPDHQAALDEVAEELENLRVAWRWVAAQGEVDALGHSVGAMWLFGASRGSRLWEDEALFAEIIDMLEQRGVPPTDRTLGRLKTAWAAMGYRLGFYPRSQAILEAAVATFRQTQAQSELAFALHHLAVVMHLLGDYPREQALLRESIALSRALEDLWLTAYSLNDLGLATHLQGNHLEAERLCQESLELFERLGEARGKAYTLGNLGVITLALGRAQEARGLHHAALALSQENADRWAVAHGLLRLSDVARAKHQLDEARQLAGQALRLAAGERIPAVVLGALTRLATVQDERGRALRWLSLVLTHPSTSREDWAEARRLWTALGGGEAGEAASAGFLPLQKAAAWLEAVCAEILEGG